MKKAEIYVVKGASYQSARSEQQVNTLLDALEERDYETLYRTEVEDNEQKLSEALQLTGEDEEGIEGVVVLGGVDSFVGSELYRAFEDLGVQFGKKDKAGDTLVFTTKKNRVLGYGVRMGQRRFVVVDDRLSLSEFDEVLKTSAMPFLSGKLNGRPHKGFFGSVFPSKGDSVGEGIRKIVLLIALITFLVSGGLLLYEGVYLPVQSDKVTSDIKDVYQKSQEETKDQPEQKDEEGRLAKFGELLKINPDIKGWITVPNTKIDYPVLQSSEDDPEYYLYRDYTGENTKYGSIFMDVHSSLGTDSKNILLHGHHMRDGRMFANLMYYSDLDFYKDAPVFTFDSIYEEAEWKIISIFKTNTLKSQGEQFGYLRGSFSDESDFLNYIYQVRARSLIDIPVDVNENDQLITLSTCSYEFDDFRTVVVARKVRENEDPSVDVDKAVKASNPLMPDIWYETYGGSAPTLTSFEQALQNGEIDWYTEPGQEETMKTEEEKAGETVSSDE